MKKTVLLLSFFILGIVSSYSQLKILNNGSARIASSTPALTRNLVQIGDTVIDPSTNYYGLTASINTKSSYCSTSIKGITNPSSNNYSYFPIGVWGEAGSGIFRSYGVVGQINGTGNGAGVFGFINNNGSLYTSISGQYAGLFQGETKIIGDLTATNMYTTSDIRLKNNVSDISEGESSNTLDKLMDVNVIKYNLKDEVFGSDGSEKSEMIENATSLLHFGVSAQELLEIYPNLVKEGQDGYLAVNYTELIPVLIRSIQELKQELDVVKGSGESRMTQSAAFTDLELQRLAKNVLYQNTPNPFKGQTTIRFQLADNPMNAAICIFDMTGKMLKKLPISSGETSVAVNGWELGEGMFLYTLLVNGQEIDTKRMIITK